MKRETKYYGVGHGPITPWGMADSRENYAPGVSFYSTPGHGGFRVTGAALARIPAQLRQTAYAPRGWYEEDCDWAIVALAFPELFTESERDQAQETLRRYMPRALTILLPSASS